MSKVEMTDEGKAIMAANGWDTGIVCFGFIASEASVKLSVAITLSGKSVEWVTLGFDSKSIASTEGMDANYFTPGSKKIMGVASEEWTKITAGLGGMPAIAIDGQLYKESDAIVKMLAEEAKVDAAQLELIELSVANNNAMLELIKHFGWAAMHEAQSYAMVSKDHYTAYGEGQKSAEWEKDKCEEAKAFLGKLEAVLAAKPAINGYYIGDALSYADCALINWPFSFFGVTGLNVEKHYPKVWANWLALKEKVPKGSEMFIFGFPMFCDFVSGANKDKRAAGFDINKYFDAPAAPVSGRDYLAAQGIEKKITDAVAIILKERPADAAKRVAELLMEK